MSDGVIKSSFYQLLAIYTVLIFLIGIGTISKYTLHFEIFSVILAIFGVISLEKKADKGINIPDIIIIFPIFIILFFRLILYHDNNIPMGYDPGIYKFIMETYMQNLPDIPTENIESWIRSGSPPGLFIITDLLYLIGLDSHSILTWFFIIFELFLGLAIYITASKFFGKSTGFFSLFIFSISIVQFKLFLYMYYKNVTALFVMLVALYLFRSGKILPFILTASFIGALHRPTFLIFGLIYIAFIIFSRKDLYNNVLNGAVILILSLTFYIPNMKEAIFENIEPLVNANIGAGTFISFFTYQFSSLSYLPLALLGFLVILKRRDFNLFFLWFLITGIIVYFRLVFFDRFIIHLDIAMIIFASIGIVELLKQNKRYGTVIIIILFFSSILMMNQNIIYEKPLISEKELNVIKQFNNVENDAYVMSISSYYSPWILGYSGRSTIAPGLFGHNNWNYSEWNKFWGTDKKETAINMLDVYEKPLYIYIGEKSRINETKFSNECFDNFFQEDRIKIYKVVCDHSDHDK